MKTPLNLHKAATLAGVSLLAAGLSGLSAADQHQDGEALTELKDGYEAKAEAEGKCGEGKCGEGKCGGDSESKADGEGKCGEGKCGEGKCGGDSDSKADGEGKCGEGKCGEGKCGAE